MSIRFNAKVPGPKMHIRGVTMDFNYGTGFGVVSAPAYERLIGDAMRGDATLFTRWDAVEQAWIEVTPIMQRWSEARSIDFPNYLAGSQGPQSADALARGGRTRMEAHLMTTPSLHVESIHDIGAILEQLRQARAATGNADGAARVATMNFVVFIDDPAHRAWVVERAALVAEKHPSRLVVLDSTSAATGVDVSTTTRERGGTTIVSERVDIAVKTIDHASIVSLTQELTVPDIPTLLWWSGERLLRSRTFSGLAHSAAGVLVDSSGMARGEETIRELGEFLTRFPGVALRDLAFMRLAPWQDMIAQFFDDPALREDLFSLTALDIESGSDAEALYLAGWLGSRLSWEPCERDAFCDRRGNRIPFTKIDKGDRRRVVRVVLRSADSTYRAELSPDDEQVVCLFVEGARAKSPRYVPLQNIANTSLIERAILENARDPIFETSLMTVRDLLG